MTRLVLNLLVGSTIIVGFEMPKALLEKARTFDANKALQEKAKDKVAEPFVDKAHEAVMNFGEKHIGGPFKKESGDRKATEGVVRGLLEGNPFKAFVKSLTPSETSPKADLQPGSVPLHIPITRVAPAPAVVPAGPGNSATPVRQAPAPSVAAPAIQHEGGQRPDGGGSRGGYAGPDRGSEKIARTV